MLHLRLSTSSADADRVLATLDGVAGVARLARGDAMREEEAVISADVDRRAADAVVDALVALGVRDEDFVIVHSDVVAPQSATAREQSGAGADTFSWVEVLGEARAHSRPFGRYVARMTAAAVIAAMGVITENAILIIGAMAVSPDLLPICATCVGIVLRRGVLAVRAFGTLILGLLLLIVISFGLAAAVEALGFLADDYRVGDGGMRTLITLHYSTALVAFAAGVAGMVSFETRAGAAVGVAISVATVPASVYVGVALGVGEAANAVEPLLTLITNVGLLIFAGSLTLLVQRRIRARRSANISLRSAPG